MPKEKGTIVAVPTSYNLYRVDENVLLVLSSQFVTQPPLIVMEALAMDGQAQLVKRIMMFDATDLIDEDGPEQETPDEPDNENLPGPWYPEGS